MGSRLQPAQKITRSKKRIDGPRPASPVWRRGKSLRNGMDFIIAGKNNFAPLSDWLQASSWVSVKFKRICRIRHMILGWLECISNVGAEGWWRRLERGIKGIIGIFFFHSSRPTQCVGQLSLDIDFRGNCNLLILHWLFTYGKIERKVGLFLRGYPRASSFCLGWLLLCQLRSEF